MRFSLSDAVPGCFRCERVGSAIGEWLKQLQVGGNAVAHRHHAGQPGGGQMLVEGGVADEGEIVRKFVL